MLGIKDALALGRKKLNKTSASSLLDAEVLLSFVLKKERDFLYSHPGYNLNVIQKFKYKALLTKRYKGMPIAYITNHKEFYGLNFYVDSNVLIPRPETELLVEAVIKSINSEQTIADIGTGSGCIAITLAKNTVNKIIATDISDKALVVAKKNATRLQANIEFYQGNLLEPINDKKIDIIVANLPYLPDNEDLTDLKYEPTSALLSGKIGFDHYDRLFQQIKELKYQPKIIFCEVGDEYTKEITEITKRYFSEEKFELKKDLAGLIRFLVIKL